MAALLLAFVISGCACDVVPEATIDSRVSRTSSSAGIERCDLLRPSQETMEKQGLSVEEVLTEPGKDAVGIRAGFALMLMIDESSTGRFRPVVRYLAERWQAESVDGDPDPAPPSDAVRKNARELDRFLAEGGCG